MSSPALLPEEMIEPEPRVLRDLRVGETGYIRFVALRVNEKRECFLDLSEKLESEQDLLTIEVRRDDDGFHITVPRDIKYKPGRLSPRPDSVPVLSITPGPALVDRFGRKNVRN